MDADHGIPNRDGSTSRDPDLDSAWISTAWPAGWTVRHIAETGSTNLDLLAAAERGEVANRAVMATDHQTAGRGRMSRTWEAPAGSNLLTSLLFADSGIEPHRCTQIVGVAAVHAIERLNGDGLGDRLGLKWPNDVLLDGRKLAGVLAHRSSQIDATVVGIGLNVGWAPTGAASLAADLGLESEPAELLREMLLAVDALVVGDVSERYLSRLLTLGQAVRIELPGDRHVHGTAVDVDSFGRIVLDVAGQRQTFDVGDIVHLRPS